MEENYSNLEYQNVFVPPSESKSGKIHETASTICSELQHYQSVKTLKDFDDIEGSRKSIQIDQSSEELQNQLKGDPYQRK